jgi:fumarate reductase flavoprotein subunit
MVDTGTDIIKSSFEEYANAEVIVEANTLEELALAIGIPVEPSAETMSKYNGYAKAGSDPDFGRADLPLQLVSPPYYAIKVSPAIHHTMGGLVIDPKAQVLNTAGQVIPGLYAAGEVTGLTHGTNRLGANAITDIMVFGRLAGLNAAQE